MTTAVYRPLAKLLIVDDEAAQMTALCRTLEDEGYATTGFTSPHKALAALREQEFDLVLTDLMMPEMDGIALLTAGQEIDRNLVAVVMTGHGAVETAVQAMQAGALDYIQKPFKLRDILPVLSRALTVRRLRTENIELRHAIAIHELSTAFIYELNPRAVANRVADAAYQQAPCCQVVMIVLSENHQELHVAAARGEDTSAIEGKRIAYTDAIKDWVAVTRRKFTDAKHWTQADFLLDCGLGDRTATIFMPMFSAGDFVGLLGFTSGSAAAITLGQLKTLSILAGTAASAMEVASLLEQLRHANEDLERRVHERTTQLEAANKELEAFSYSVSHDLRAPLRALRGYSDVLLQDCRDQLNAEAQRALNAIDASGQRMSELIEDLLKFSHLSRQSLVTKRIQTSTLVKQIVEELNGSHANSDVEVKLGDLPDCMGDESLLKQVFVNLLSNAYKFTKQTSSPCVEIGASEQRNELIYFVRDNGAGFDMQEAEKLFGVFQRLHSPDQFEGTGIGLSIVQRIVNRHGGRVWAEGEVQKGATFYFSLPRAE
jgi:signal transduction histidine kinase/FixJ family two-component response regulator